MVYKLLLFTHSWLRWLVLILMLISLTAATVSLLQRTTFTKRHERLFRIYRTCLGIEVLIGMLLYFIWSPLVTQVLYHGLSFFDSAYIVFTLKHPLAMFVAFILCRGIENKTLKSTDDRKKFRIWLWGNVAVLILILLAIPWPFYEGFGRPWVR
jgi:hypothetical protein